MNKSRTNPTIVEIIHLVFGFAPWFVLSWMSVITTEQWQILSTQTAADMLRDLTKQQVMRALRKYPRNFAVFWSDDIVTEVLLKLREGKFLKNYDPVRGDPRAFLSGSSFQYARTLSRSYWRRYGRNGA